MEPERVTQLPELPEEIEKTAGIILREKGMTVGTAESCTGGGIAARLTAVPGSSVYFRGGVVAYANDVKISLLNVSSETLETFGAVSEEAAIEMVKGAMDTLKTDCAIVSTGIAGPTGGTEYKPVGTVWLAAGTKNKIITFKQEKDEGRSENIEKAIGNALLLLLKLLN